MNKLAFYVLVEIRAIWIQGKDLNGRNERSPHVMETSLHEKTAAREKDISINSPLLITKPQLKKVAVFTGIIISTFHREVM